MANAAAFEGNIKRYVSDYNQAAAEKIVGHLGIALRHRDSSIVSCGDDGELDRVRERWCRGKLGVAANQSEIDTAIATVCEIMKEDGGHRCRVTFYYLLAEHFGKLGHLAR